MTRHAALLALLLLSACTRAPQACGLVAVQSGVHVDTADLPAGASGQVCLAAGACVAVSATDPVPLVLDLPDAPATAQVEVRLVGRPVEQVSVPLRASYPNGRDCGPAGYRGRMRLTAGASTVD